MTNELLALFEYYEKEKGIDRSTMVEAIEGALLSASRKSIGPARELRIDMDPDKGKIEAKDQEALLSSLPVAAQRLEERLDDGPIRVSWRHRSNEFGWRFWFPH